MKLFKNEKGISLVGVLIAAGAVGGLALVMGKLGENQSKMQRKALEDQDVNQFVNDTNKHLLNDAGCKNTFSSITGLSSDGDKKLITSIKNFSGTIVYNTSNKPISHKLKITKMEVERIDSQSIELAIYVEKTKQKGSFGAKSFIKRFKLDAKINGLG